MLVIAHRGTVGGIAENTLAALQACIEVGILWAEVDVRATADGHHVLIHDADLHRTLSSEMRVDQTSLVALQRIAAESPVSSEPIPTLADALAVARGRLGLYLDCRNVKPAELFWQIRDSGMADSVLVTLEPRDLEPGGFTRVDELKLVAPWTGHDEHPEQAAVKLNCSVMEVPASVANAEMFARARDLKLQVGCLTLRGDDTPEQWQRCRDLGADWIMTDRPIDAARALQTQ